MPGWPVTVTTEVNSSPAVGDINGDGFNEGIVGIGEQDRSDDGAMTDVAEELGSLWRTEESNSYQERG